MRLRQPAWGRVLPSELVVNVAMLGPVGKRLPAPGTWGSVAGLLWFTLFFQWMSPLGVIFWSCVAAYLAVVFCGEAELRLQKRDPGGVVLDEVVAVPLCFINWSLLTSIGGHEVPNWAVFLTGFGLFRLFDILKPFGISRLQNLPGGWGVVADDLAAALAACAGLHVLWFLAGLAV